MAEQPARRDGIVLCLLRPRRDDSTVPLGESPLADYPCCMSEHAEAVPADSDPEFDEFAAAQDGDYEPEIDEAEVLADEDERPIDDDLDDGFPDDERVVVFDDEPGEDEA